MQPVNPYQFIATIGTCQVGRVCSAVDAAGRRVTVAVLEGPAAADQRWRQAFANAANALAQPAAGALRYVQADFSASTPWVAYPASGGPGAERLFQALGMQCQPAQPPADRPAQPPADRVVTAAAGPAQQSPPTAVPATTNPQSVQGALAQPTQAIPTRPVPAAPVEATQVLPVLPRSAPPAPVSPAATTAAGNAGQAAETTETGQPPAPLFPWDASGSAAQEPPPFATEPVSVPPHSVSGPPMVAQVPQDTQAPAQSAVPAVPQTPANQAMTPGPQPASAPLRSFTPAEPSGPRVGLWLAIAALVLVLFAAGGGLLAWASLRGNGDAQPLPTDTSSALPDASLPDPGIKPWAQAAPYSREERALAVASPSLVYVEGIFTGYLRNKSNNLLLRKEPIIFNRRCSGIVVSPDGYTVTSSSCVQPTDEEARKIALYAYARMLVRAKKLTQKRVDAYVNEKMGTTLFTGADPAAPADAKLYGQLNVAAGNLTNTPAIPADSVKVFGANAGNIAVIKLSGENLPTVEISPSATLGPGKSMLIVGYRTGDKEYRNAVYVRQSKTVVVTSVGRRGSVPVYRINDDVGESSHGGLVLDADGRLIGMVDHDLARPDRANRVVVSVATIDKLLSDAKVTNSLGEADKLYRSGIDAYFAGRYSTAVSQLNAVVEKSPTNLLAQSYRQNAETRRRIEGDGASSTIWLVSILSGLGGAVVVGIVVLAVVLSKRRRRREAVGAPDPQASVWSA